MNFYDLTITKNWLILAQKITDNFTSSRVNDHDHAMSKLSMYDTTTVKMSSYRDTLCSIMWRVILRGTILYLCWCSSWRWSAASTPWFLWQAWLLFVSSSASSPTCRQEQPTREKRRCPSVEGWGSPLGHHLLYSICSISDNSACSTRSSSRRPAVPGSREERSLWTVSWKSIGLASEML